MIATDRLRAAAEAYGTPVYVYDLDAVTARANALREALPARVEVAFAVKANPSLAVLQTLAAAGLGADVASGGELAAVGRAGFPASRTIFTGPGKTPDELATAASSALRAVTVESRGELERLAAAARRIGRRVPVLLRAAGGDRPGNVIGAGHGRFGMRPEDLVAAARDAVADADLELVGLHRFEASNLTDAGDLLDAARRTLEIATDLAREIGVALRIVDVGGGLGIPYRDGEPELDIRSLGAGLTELVERLDTEPLTAGATLLLEPGRYLVGPTGAYVTRVLDTKVGEHGPVVTVDGGVHHLLRPAIVGEPHRIRSLEDATRRPMEVLVGGPLCTGLDLLGRATLPEPRVGDLLAIADAGAYGFTESMPLFLSHPMPAEIVLRGDRMDLARPRLEPDEVLARQRDVLTEGAADT